MSTAFRLIGVAVLAISFSACSREPAPRLVAPAVPKPILIDISAKVQLGREALAAQRFDDAVAVLSEAVKLRPDDAAARELLDQATADKRKDDFAKSLKSGRAALEAENYETAFAELSAAVKLMPDDQDAETLLEQAEFSWRRQQGRAAMDSKRFQDAVNGFSAALTLRPDDALCRKLLDEAQAARRAQIMMEFGAAMTAGKAGMAEKNYKVATSSFALALTLVPDNKEARKLHGEAQLQQNKIDGDQAKVAGKTAMDGNRLADALRELDRAKRLIPGDAEVEALWREAQARKTRQVADEARQRAEAAAKKKKQDYDGHVSRARISLASRRYDDAIRACRDAEGLIPGGEAAAVRSLAESQQRLDYSNHITKARIALTAKRPDEALRECDAADSVMRFGGESAGIRAQARVMQQPPITIPSGPKKK